MWVIWLVRCDFWCVISWDMGLSGISVPFVKIFTLKPMYIRLPSGFYGCWERDVCFGGNVDSAQVLLLSNRIFTSQSFLMSCYLPLPDMYQSSFGIFGFSQWDLAVFYETISYDRLKNNCEIFVHYWKSNTGQYSVAILSIFYCC